MVSGVEPSPASAERAAAAVPDRPLASLFVTGFNQADTIREALEAALAQTWRPLDLLFSDDASEDGTFEIMREVAERHQGREAEGLSVRVRRSTVNGGIIDNVNRVMEAAQGELIVMAGGDDVSAPHRVVRLVEAWEGSGRGAHLLHSAAAVIDVGGRPTGARRSAHPALLAARSPAEVLASPRTALGATMAWTRALFDRFGPLPREALVEDPLLTLRASLLGPIVYVDEPLVSWREGGVSWTPPRVSARERLYGAPLRLARWRSAACRAFLKDLERLGGPDRDAARDLASAQADHLGLQVDLADAGRIGRLALLPRALAAALRTGSSRPAKLALQYLFDAPYMRLRDGRGGAHLETRS